MNLAPRAAFFHTPIILSMAYPLGLSRNLFSAIAVGLWLLLLCAIGYLSRFTSKDSFRPFYAWLFTFVAGVVVFAMVWPWLCWLIGVEVVFLGLWMLGKAGGRNR